MSNRKKRTKMTRRINLSRGQWKIVVAVVAVAVVAVVLTVSMRGGQDNAMPAANRTVALLDGEEITEQDVADARVVVYWAWGQYIGRQDALEHIIGEKLLYREAEQEGYVPTVEDTWAELSVFMGVMGLTSKEFEERLGWDGISLDEYAERYRRILAINAFLEDAVEISEVTEEEIGQFYDGYVEDRRQKYPDEEPPTLEEMEPHIVVVLEGRKRQEAASDLVQQLRETADIEYMDVDW
jgi:hypothetical protein